MMRYKQTKNVLFIGALLLLSGIFQLFTARAAYAQEVKTIEPGDCAEGVISPDNPMDEYTFTAEKYTLSYRVDLCSSVVKNPDLTVGIYDESGALLGENSDWTPNGEVFWYKDEYEYFAEAPKCKPGKYFIRVTASGTALAETDYQIKLTKSNQYGTIKVQKRQDIYTGKRRRLPRVTVYDCAGKKIDQSEYTYWFCNDGEHEAAYWDGKCHSDTYVTELGTYSLCIRYHSDLGYFNEPTPIDRFDTYIRNIYIMKPEQAKIQKVESRNGKITAVCKTSKCKNSDIRYVWQISEKPDFKIRTTKHLKGTHVKFNNLQKGKIYYIRVYIEKNLDITHGECSKTMRVKCR